MLDLVLELVDDDMTNVTVTVTVTIYIVSAIKNDSNQEKIVAAVVRQVRTIIHIQMIILQI